jgi:hypothetical protein
VLSPSLDQASDGSDRSLRAPGSAQRSRSTTTTFTRTGRFNVAAARETWNTGRPPGMPRRLQCGRASISARRLRIGVAINSVYELQCGRASIGAETARSRTPFPASISHRRCEWRPCEDLLSTRLRGTHAVEARICWRFRTRAPPVTVPAPLGRSEVDEQHLILAVMNQLAQRVPAAGQVGRREPALEHRVLKAVSEPDHRLVDAAQAEVVGDVVAHQKGVFARLSWRHYGDRFAICASDKKCHRSAGCRIGRALAQISYHGAWIPDESRRPSGDW